MIIKLFRYGVCEKEFISRAQLDEYATKNIGVPTARLGAYGYTVKEAV